MEIQTARRIARQLLTESVLLAGLGGLAGIALAYAGTQMLLALAFPDAKTLPIHASPSPIALAFACGLSLLTGVLFGVAPAWIAAQAEPAARLNAKTIPKRRMAPSLLFSEPELLRLSNTVTRPSPSRPSMFG